MKDKTSNKTKLTLILLNCLDWGCSSGWDKCVKKLKIENDYDPYRIRSCIDLIQDTEEAIISFSRFGLEKYQKKINTDIGGDYLRLYGILNAIQLQKLAIIELFEVLKLRNKKEIVNKLNSLEAVEIRNIAGAHTIDLFENGDHFPKGVKKNFFRISQPELTPEADSIYAVSGFGKSRQYNLYDSIIEFNEVTEKILYNCVIEYTSKIWYNNTAKQSHLLAHFKLEKLIPFDYKSLYENKRRRDINFHRSNKEFESDRMDYNELDWNTRFLEEMKNNLEKANLEIEKQKNKNAP